MRRKPNVREPGASFFFGTRRLVLAVGVLTGVLNALGCQERSTEPLAPSHVMPPGTLTIEWEPPTHRTNGEPLSGLVGYLVQVGTAPDRFAETIRIGPWPRYTVRGLKSGVRYYVRIAAYDEQGRQSAWSETVSYVIPFPQRINFVPPGTGRTPNPSGWVTYDGAPYHPDRGFGWLHDVRGQARDRGLDAQIVLEGGQVTTPGKLGRPELATMHSLHGENRLRVFRFDLPNGWYRVTCSSVDPGGPLPLVDQRSFKCRSGDVVFAGPRYGPPLTVKGNELVEGSDLVEVTHGHLRIVVGDPAYGGWTWRYRGPWYSGWLQWLKKGHLYANGWLQKLTRTVDPGYHSVRLNALRIEPSEPPPAYGRVVFAETFHREDSEDVNAGVAAGDRWIVLRDTATGQQLRAGIYRTALRVQSRGPGQGQFVMVRSLPERASGLIEVSMRVSLFTGAGSHSPIGRQETGLMLLAAERDRDRSDTLLSLGYETETADVRRVQGYVRVQLRQRDGTVLSRHIEESRLPFHIRAGEYRLALRYQASDGLLRSITINDRELLPLLPSSTVRLLPPRGVGIQAIMTQEGEAPLRQYYWAIRARQIDGE